MSATTQNEWKVTNRERNRSSERPPNTKDYWLANVGKTSNRSNDLADDEMVTEHEKDERSEQTKLSKPSLICTAGVENIFTL